VFLDAPDGEVASGGRDRFFARAGNFRMVHVYDERCWNIVDETAVDAARKPGYWSARIVEVKTLSAMDEELIFEVWRWEVKTYGRLARIGSFESAKSRSNRPDRFCIVSL
jgi:hypothetical protein